MYKLAEHWKSGSWKQREDAETSAQENLWEETLRRRLGTQSVGAIDGREPTWKRENARYASRELPQTVGAVGDSLWMWMYAVQRIATASPILELLFHTG